MPVVCVAMVVLVISGCSKRQEDRPVATRDSVRAGPIGRTDATMNAIAPELEEWVAMWRTVIPGFEVDSLWGGKRQKWVPDRVSKLESNSDNENDEDTLTFRVLGIPSPDGHRILYIDSYQWIQGGEGGIEAGGEPDSKPVLIDRHARIETDLEFCGTTCGFHWGRWLSADRFALGGWSDAGEDGQWKLGSLSIYDVRDSTVINYVTRSVPDSEYARYHAAWKQWLLKRYRETRPRT
jgi:hypothetical protein